MRSGCGWQKPSIGSSSLGEEESYALGGEFLSFFQKFFLKLWTVEDSISLRVFLKTLAVEGSIFSKVFLKTLDRLRLHFIHFQDAEGQDKAEGS
jgi:hypothetical protein